jgi:hypothetical protein
MITQSSIGIRMAFTGDLALAGDIISAVRPKDASSLFHLHQLEPELKNSDVLVVNLEGPIGNSGPPRPGVTSRLFNDVAVLEWLKRFPVVVCCLANNHMMDFGGEALLRTQRLLSAHGIHHVGAGENAEQASAALIMTVKGTKLAILNATTDEKHVGSILAESGSPGSAAIGDPIDFIERVAALARTVDVVIVNLHWGFEYFHNPAPEQVDFCRRLAVAGATLVIGHHPHVYQGIEQRGSSLIAYSLGNLLLSPLPATNGRIQYRKPATRQFSLLRTHINKHQLVAWDLVGGFWNRRYQLIPYSGLKKIDFDEAISALSINLEINDYQSFWTQYRMQRIKELQREALHEIWEKAHQMGWKSLLRSFTIEDIYRNFRRLLQAMLRCARRN